MYFVADYTARDAMLVRKHHGSNLISHTGKYPCPSRRSPFRKLQWIYSWTLKTGLKNRYVLVIYDFANADEASGRQEIQKRVVHNFVFRA